MPKNKDNINFYQVAICGDGGVGKTSVTIQYSQNKFEGEDVYDPTIESSFVVRRQYEDISLELEIVDTAGQDDYKALRYNYMNSCYGFIFVFDVTKAEQSILSLVPYVEQIRSIKADKYQPVAALNNLDFPCILLGNKCDLVNHIPEKTIQQIIQSTLKLECPVFYVSAKTRKNIEEAFQQFTRVLRVFETSQKNPEWKYPSHGKSSPSPRLGSSLSSSSLRSSSSSKTSKSSNSSAGRKKNIFASLASDDNGLDRFEDDGL
ncbi:hypothetical protein FDP41_006383 [Naegleria fowleri]|uniref:Uncharacterized protein n=1 Tax=Naegleria fowleri TaxID=5763 RepID=A0A6A5BIU0_NAEFO|nr:uncharacterized protein FDP41_006383 [Naegleria fowleri]KAF0974351.1 hypothetical protein FDP41_006383 [Naegleria fowleri]